MALSTDIFKRTFWAMSAEETLSVLETSADGLLEREAEERVRIFGKNILGDEKVPSSIWIFLRQLQSPLILILIASSVITFFLHDARGSAFIAVTVLVNAVIGFLQENRAEQALQKLKGYLRARIRVLRDRREYEIETSELVPGDLIRLFPGDRIPADARLLFANDLQVDESILTGESLPVSKSSARVSAAAGLAERECLVFAGTLQTQGVGTALVVATGRSTEIGKIAALVQAGHEKETPLQASIRRFSYQLSLILGSLATLVFIEGLILGHSFSEVFLVSVAIAVAAVPEGLPLSLTVILAIGVEHLARKRGVVRRLLAAETLGSTSIILSDKTGTLTEAKMSLSQIISFDSKQDKEELLRLALLNVDVLIENPDEATELWRIDGKPLEVAVVRASADHHFMRAEVLKNAKIHAYLPFNSKNKFSASIVSERGHTHAVFLGAPDILTVRSHFSGTKGEEEKNAILSEIARLAESGARVLGVAVKKMTHADTLENPQMIKDLTLLGLIAFRDPLRKSARQALEEVTEAGVKTVIVTGDHRGTAEAVARELGFEIDQESILDAPELEHMSADELKKRLPLVKIFSRVSPEDKLKIAIAYQELGEVVAMTGDGVNDAPAIRRADIGIAMGSATDVTKDVADLVILDNNFETIVEAVKEGRNMRQNIRKVIVYLLAGSLDHILLIGGSLILGLPLPLNALQILWINFFDDSLPAASFAFEHGIDKMGKRPMRVPKNLLDSEMLFLVLVIGTFTSLLIMGLYFALSTIIVPNPADGPLVRTFIFFVVGTYNLFLALAVKSLTRPIFSYNIFANPLLFSCVLFGIMLMLSAVYLPPFQALFGTVALPSLWLLGAFGVGILNIALVEFGKALYRRREA